MSGKAKRLVAGHVLCNVTALIDELDKFDSELALDLLHGDPESEQLAYAAAQIWVVSDWLGGELRKHNERVHRIDNQSYWARGATGPALDLDDVIRKIAREKV